MNDMTNIRRLDHRRKPIDGLLRRAQEEERRRIARDLHDSTSQYLVGLQFSMAQLKQAPLSDLFRTVLADCELALTSIQREIRTLSYLCHPPLLGNKDLGPVLEAMTRGVADRAGLSVTIEVEEIGEIRPAMEAALYRLTQEALANICRHAKANRIRMRLAGTLKYVHLIIEDDGVGLGGGATISAGVGITGMRERIAQMGGRLSIRHQDHGTRLLASLPRQQRERSDHLNGSGSLRPILTRTDQQN
jgi:two-component system, NarL family, sensor kinase